MGRVKVPGLMSYLGCKVVPRFGEHDAISDTKVVTRKPARCYGRPGTPLGGPPRPEGVDGPVDGRTGAIVGATGEPRRPGASPDLPCTVCCTSIARWIPCCAASGRRLASA